MINFLLGETAVHQIEVLVSSSNVSLHCVRWLTMGSFVFFILLAFWYNTRMFKILEPSPSPFWFKLV